MDESSVIRRPPGQRQPLLISLLLLGLFVLVWHLATRLPGFDPRGLSPAQLEQMEFNGDIVRTDDGTYRYNPEKARGLPGPWAVVLTAVDEFSAPFHKRGTNDHGIGHLIRYTVARFATGFLSASIVAILIGVCIGLSRTLYRALNPFIQVLKPISPLAWMPLLLYTVQHPTWTAILVTKPYPALSVAWFSCAGDGRVIICAMVRSPHEAQAGPYSPSPSALDFPVRVGEARGASGRRGHETRAWREKTSTAT
jgi:nitrate/nitrite transport system permease protein